MGIFNPPSFGAGSVSAPSLFLAGDTGTGFYRPNGSQWMFAAIGANVALLYSGGLRFSSTEVLGFSSGDTGVSGADIGVSRGTAGIAAIGNGNQGDATGKVNCAAYQVAGTQVVSSRITGYGTPTGNANQGSFAAASITLPNLAAGVAQLILDLKTHGLLGT